MLTDQDMQALVTATTNKLQVVINYVKKTTGEYVTHTCGIQEIGAHNKSGEPGIWGWDTSLNDNIRFFAMANIQSIEVQNIPFFPVGGYPIKINGQIVG